MINRLGVESSTNCDSWFTQKETRNVWLVLTLLKNMKVHWDDYSQYMEKSSKCSKPPTRFCVRTFKCVSSYHPGLERREHDSGFTMLWAVELKPMGSQTDGVFMGESNLDNDGPSSPRDPFYPVGEVLILFDQLQASTNSKVNFRDRSTLGTWLFSGLRSMYIYII